MQFDLDILFQIGDRKEFSPQIGRLVGMMDYARFTTLNTVNGMSMEEIDYLHDPNSNSIAALLSHMASVETYYQLNTIEGFDMSEEDWESFKPGMMLGDLGREKIKGKPLSFYVDQLQDVRNRTYAFFKELNDDWLYETEPFFGKKPTNNYFKWFHVLEDEINHRGQMRWLKKRLPVTA